MAEIPASLSLWGAALGACFSCLPESCLPRMSFGLSLTFMCSSHCLPVWLPPSPQGNLPGSPPRPTAQLKALSLGPFLGGPRLKPPAPVTPAVMS